MEESSKHRLEVPEDAAMPRHVVMWKWFAFYFAFLAVTSAMLVVLLGEQSPRFSQELHQFAVIKQTVHPWYKMLAAEGRQLAELVAAASAALKSVLLVLYCAVAITFFPVPTTAVIAAAATTKAAMPGGPVAVTLELSLLCAAASTIANLTDFHIFLSLLRSRRIAKIRDTKLYKLAAKWFAKGPFAIMVIFNIIPLPVDVIRILSAVYGVRRRVFAAANFVGRFFRYGLIVALTICLGPKYEWISPLALLGLSAVIAMVKLAPAMGRRIVGSRE